MTNYVVKEFKEKVRLLKGDADLSKKYDGQLLSIIMVIDAAFVSPGGAFFSGIDKLIFSCYA